jgi:hypothetical protein
MVTLKRLLHGALLLMPLITSAQFILSPVTQSTTSALRNKELPAMALPFWDDFSSAQNSDTLWMDQSTVWINDGMGIRPPTINVATFDGLDANGVPYSPNANQSLDYGFTDSLVSRKLRMADVPVFVRNSVFLSFFYQWGGNGEVPDANDFLRLEFLTSTGQWITAMTLQSQSTQNPDQFYSVTLRINQPEYFHNDFQFRFRSSGRRSGRYDTWNIDYIYLNRGRTENDLSQGFPDRATNLPLTSLFTPYYAMPLRHFFDDPDASTGFPSFGVTNLSSIPQPMNYAIDAAVEAYSDGNKETLFFTSAIEQPILPTVGPFEQRLITFTAKPDLSQFQNRDSVWLSLQTTLVTGDSVNTGFEPLNFYINDTIRQTYVLKDYYAYDDGSAEYSVGLTQSGNRAAYRFILKNKLPDTLNGIYIHYPFTSGSTASNFRLQVWDNKDGKPDQLILEELIPVQRIANSQFVARTFSQAILVKDTIYIGWQQPSVGRVQIGLDTSHDTGEHIFVNTTGSWAPNITITGSLMIRPRFGKGNVITSTERALPALGIYPNPNSGEFTINGRVQAVSVRSISGTPQRCSVEEYENKTHIRMDAVKAGLYLVQYHFHGRIFTEKIIVNP